MLRELPRILTVLVVTHRVHLSELLELDTLKGRNLTIGEVYLHF